MYLSGSISVDPSQLTELHRVKPTKGFARLAHILTGGMVASQEERETFCAVSVLQQINIVMRSVGVDNIVRLAKDDTVLYEDSEGKQGDLKEALDAFASRMSDDMSHSFQTLNLVLEHESGDLRLLVDIRIHRSHAVGEHPIQITVNGLAQELNGNEGEDAVRGEMEKIFASQANYDEFVSKQKEAFERFLASLRDAFQKHMSVDEVTLDSKANIVRPKHHRRESSHVTDSRTDPVFDGYHGYDNAFLYAWLWSDFCHEHDIHCRDVTVVDAQGEPLFEVGEVGFQSGEGGVLDSNADFVLPETDDIKSFEDIAVATDINENLTQNLPSGGDTGGWFSSISDSVSNWDAGSGGGCAGSSCGSSCGGGCGGS